MSEEITDAEKMSKLKYEALVKKFQNYCKHDGGRHYDGTGKTDICAICGWDTKKCQHKKADAWDKYCRECGKNLMEVGE